MTSSVVKMFLMTVQELHWTIYLKRIEYLPNG